MIRVSLSTHPRAGRIDVCGTRYELATWFNAGIPVDEDDEEHPGGLLLGMTTDGQRVTLATEKPDDDKFISGALCIGNGLDAPRWTIRNARRVGKTLTGHAYEVPSDAWLEAYIERMARLVRA
jgi:hypothetical protein